MPEHDNPVSFTGRSVTIACTDRERSEAFYAGVLGAAPIPGDGYGCRWYQLGSLTISLAPNAQRVSPATFPEHAMPMLWLEVDDIRLAHERLKGAGTRIIQAPDDGMFMLVADPDGLVIEIWQQPVRLPSTATDCFRSGRGDEFDGDSQGRQSVS